MKLKSRSAQLQLSVSMFSLLSSAITGSAYAVPYHRSIQADPINFNTSNCVYPDGTSPAGQPKIHCYQPKEFLKAYGIDKLHAAGLTGKGQTIILADSFGSPTMQADLDHFSDTFGLPRTTIQFIYPNGPYTNDLSDADKVGWAGETTLDLEWAHAIAPDATLVNIVTSTSETVGLAGLPDLFNGIQTAITRYPGAIISMSFGTGEPTFTASDIKDYLQGSFHQILTQATAADITLLASSGDSGSTNMGADQKTLVGYANASYPATDPLITAVGGTALQYGWKWTPEGTADDYWNCQLSQNANCPTDFMASTLASGSSLETVWKEDWAVAAGGGGVSTIFSAPDYQANLDVGVKKTMNGHRGIPDISLNAAINGGVDVYSSYSAPQFGANGPAWQSTGGTSCAAPETAALVALAGQKASEALGKTVGIGYLNAILYSLNSNDFNDIVSQNIGNSSQVSIDNDALYFSSALFSASPSHVPPVLVPGYFTTAGYDLATGLGSPKAVKFVADVAAARTNRR